MREHITDKSTLLDLAQEFRINHFKRIESILKTHFDKFPRDLNANLRKIIKDNTTSYMVGDLVILRVIGPISENCTIRYDYEVYPDD